MWDATKVSSGQHTLTEDVSWYDVSMEWNDDPKLQGDWFMIQCDKKARTAISDSMVNVLV